MIPAVKHPIEPICLLEEGGKNSVDKKKNINIFNSCGVFSKQLYGRDKSKRSNIAQIPVRKKKKMLMILDGILVCGAITSYTTEKRCF